MFAYLKGTLHSSGPLEAVIDINGVGYEVHYPITTAEKLPADGSEVKLYTHVVYREDAQTIYAFHSTEDKDFFKLLTQKVSGIGPKIAINIMSRLSVTLLKQAIFNADVVLLAKCPGIGKKTAERVVIELKDKLGAEQSSLVTPASSEQNSQVSTSAPSNNVADAVSALISLGYKAADADKSVRKAANQMGADCSTEELIRAALK